MQLYIYADLTVSSTLPLPDLPTVRRDETEAPDFAFGLLASPPESASDEWIHRWRTQAGTPTLSLAKTGEGFLLRFPNLADFTITADGRQIGAWPAKQTTAETLRHLLLDQMLPRLVAHRGRLALHAGAVRVGNRAIAFLGQTGWGKSTLAGSFYGAGYPLLSDDGLVLTQGVGCTLALPTYPSLRLWPEAVAGLFEHSYALVPMAHYSSKQRVVVEDAAERAGYPLPLAAIYVLAQEAAQAGAPTLSLNRLSPRDTCMAIISSAFVLDVTDRRRTAGLLAAAADIAQHLPAFKLAFPRDFACLPVVRAAILDQRDRWAGGARDISSPG